MKHRVFALLGVLVFAFISPALSQQAPPPNEVDRRTEEKAAFKGAADAAVKGPADIPLADEADLHLPDHRYWVPRAQGERLLRAWGNQPGSNLLGLVAGVTDNHQWFATVTVTRDGFVKDDDAKDLDPEKLLAGLRQDAEASNQQRMAQGFSGIVLDDWMQRPSYDAVGKRLVWALPVRDVGGDANSATINYNTRALGRDGYISLNLLTDTAHFAAEKPAADALLTDLAYRSGKRYQDFNVSTDHVAEYGLAALIGVVALKKLGLIALGTAFFLKFAKLGVIAVLGIGAAIRKFLRRDKGSPTA